MCPGAQEPENLFPRTRDEEGEPGLCTCLLETKRLRLENGLAHCHTSLRSQVKGHFSMHTFLLGPLILK